MKKGLLTASLILLIAGLGVEGLDILEILNNNEYLHLLILGCLGTGILGALYPQY